MVEIYISSFIKVICILHLFYVNKNAVDTNLNPKILNMESQEVN